MLINCFTSDIFGLKLGPYPITDIPSDKVYLDSKQPAVSKHFSTTNSFIPLEEATSE